jgi:hypothetical protein
LTTGWNVDLGAGYAVNRTLELPDEDAASGGKGVQVTV